MNITEIKLLVEKYFEGETTLQEEEKLREFFSSTVVPAELAEFVPVFAYFNEEKKIVSSSVLPTKPAPAKVIPIARKRSFWLAVSGIAASIIFIVTIVVESGKKNPAGNENYIRQQYSNEEINSAYNQTREVLAFVSNKFSQGTQPLNKVSKIGYSEKPFEQIKKFDKGLSNLSGNIDKMENGIETMSKLSKINIIIKL